MDTIQKTLIEAGRKDLAQEYYKKIALIPSLTILRQMKNELATHKQHIEDFLKFIIKYKKANFDQGFCDELLDSSTNVKIKIILERINNAEFELENAISK